ncbi:MAG: hypothetical protein IKA31_02710, partial [Clostridia bacterium]|nr:hypothetical protein [Clostridia bacterium]
KQGLNPSPSHVLQLILSPQLLKQHQHLHPEGVNQTRRYIWHTYSNDFIESTYSVTGSGLNIENWNLINQKQYFNRRLAD